MIEMKDQQVGRVYARKGTITAQNKPTGKIMELIEVPLHVEYPQETFGTPVGPWIENEARLNDEDMQMVAGLREVSLGNAPTGVSAYASMALLAEQDERRVGPVLKLVRQGIGDLVLLTLELIKEYWPEGKHMAVAGPDGAMEEFIYMRSQLPEKLYVDVSKNAPLPTSPATEAQKIFDIYHAVIAAGAPLPRMAEGAARPGQGDAVPKRETGADAQGGDGAVHDAAGADGDPGLLRRRLHAHPGPPDGRDGARRNPEQPAVRTAVEQHSDARPERGDEEAGDGPGGAPARAGTGSRPRTGRRTCRGWRRRPAGRPRRRAPRTGRP